MNTKNGPNVYCDFKYLNSGPNISNINLNGSLPIPIYDIISTTYQSQLLFKQYLNAFLKPKLNSNSNPKAITNGNDRKQPQEPLSMDFNKNANANTANYDNYPGNYEECEEYEEYEEYEERPKLSIVIFDWDDTLMPTTAVINKKHRDRDISSDDLVRFGESLYGLLSTWITIYGKSNIYIVTNAGSEWVFKSLKLMSSIYQTITKNEPEKQEKDYFAAVYNSFRSLNIRIISAQDLYSMKYPQKPQLWKIKAFKQIIIEHFKNIRVNTHCGNNNNDNIYEIVSIGDSENEYIASYEAKYKLNKYIKRRKSMNNIIRLHRVKLKKKPSITDMINQMNVLQKEAAIMNTECGSITIRYQ